MFGFNRQKARKCMNPDIPAGDRLATDRPAATAAGNTIRVSFIDLSQNVRDNAVDGADQHLLERNRMQRYTGIGGLFRRAWNKLSGEVVRQTEIHERMDTIRRTRNLFAGQGHLGANVNQMQADMSDAVVERFEHGGREALSTNLGEHYDVLGVTTPGMTMPERTLVNRIQQLFEQYEQNTSMTQDALETAARNHLRTYIRDAGADARMTEAEIMATNLVAQANAYRANPTATLEIGIGAARVGVRTDAKHSFIDRTVDAVVENSFIGGWIEPGAAVAATAAIATGAYYAGQVAARSAAYATLGLVGGAAAGGAILGATEGRKIENDLRTHSRDMAANAGDFNTVRQQMAANGGVQNRGYVGFGINTTAGGELEYVFAPDAQQRRHQLEEYRQTTIHVEHLISQLSAAATAVQTARLGGNLAQMNTAYTNAMDCYATCLAMDRFSDHHSIDLIGYTHGSRVEIERRDFRRGLTELREELGQLHTAANPAAVPPFAQTLQAAIDTEHRALNTIAQNGDIHQREQEFAAYKRRRILRVGFYGALIGTTVGTASYYATQAIGDLLGHGVMTTPSTGTSHTGANVVTDAAHPNGHTVSQLPHLQNSGNVPSQIKGLNGSSLVLDQSTNTYNVVQNGNVLANGVRLDSNGALTQASRDALEKQGFNFFDHAEAVASTKTVSTRMSASDFLDKMNAQTVVRGHMHNNTPIFDHNELNLYWGNNGTGIRGNSYIYEFDPQTVSWAGSDVVDPRVAAANGDIRLHLSLSEGTQGRVIEVPFKVVNGRIEAEIPMDSDIGRAFFREVNGRAEFIGRFAEVAEVHPQGGYTYTKVLATDEGLGRDMVGGTVTETVYNGTNHTVMQAPLVQEVDPAGLFVPLAFSGRSPLEARAIQHPQTAQQGNQPTPPSGGNGGGGGGNTFSFSSMPGGPVPTAPTNFTFWPNGAGNPPHVGGGAAGGSTSPTPPIPPSNSGAAVAIPAAIATAHTSNGGTTPPPPPSGSGPVGVLNFHQAVAAKKRKKGGATPPPPPSGGGTQVATASAAATQPVGVPLGVSLMQPAAAVAAQQSYAVPATTLVPSAAKTKVAVHNARVDHLIDLITAETAVLQADGTYVNKFVEEVEAIIDGYNKSYKSVMDRLDNQLKVLIDDAEYVKKSINSTGVRKRASAEKRLVKGYKTYYYMKAVEEYYANNPGKVQDGRLASLIKDISEQRKILDEAKYAAV